MTSNIEFLDLAYAARSLLVSAKSRVVNKARCFANKT